jgi:hypothetical protein
MGAVAAPGSQGGRDRARGEGTGRGEAGGSDGSERERRRCARQVFDSASVFLAGSILASRKKTKVKLFLVTTRDS